MNALSPESPLIIVFCVGVSVSVVFSTCICIGFAFFSVHGCSHPGYWFVSTVIVVFSLWNVCVWFGAVSWIWNVPCSLTLVACSSYPVGVFHSSFAVALVRFGCVFVFCCFVHVVIVPFIVKFVPTITVVGVWRLFICKLSK